MKVYVKHWLKQLHSIKPHVPRVVYPHLKALFEITFHGSVFFKVIALCISKHFLDTPQWVNGVQKWSS